MKIAKLERVRIITPKRHRNYWNFVRDLERTLMEARAEILLVRDPLRIYQADSYSGGGSVIGLYYDGINHKCKIPEFNGLAILIYQISGPCSYRYDSELERQKFKKRFNYQSNGELTAKVQSLITEEFASLTP